MAKSTENFEKVASFQKEAVDAFVEMAATSGKGFEKLQAEIMAYAKSSGEAFVAASRSIFGAKSFEQAVQAQQDYAKSAFEAHMIEMARLGQMFSDAMKAAIEPVASQAKFVAQKFEFRPA